MQRIARYDRVDALHGHQVRRRERGGRVGGEGGAERVHAVARDRQPGGGPVAAVAQQVGACRVQPAEQVERRDRAARAGALVAVERDQHGRAVVALGDPRGDDADHAGMPAVGREDVRRRLRSAVPRGRDLRLGLEQDPRLDVAPLDVDRVELGRDRAGPLQVRGEQQLEAGIRAVQPPGRVDARREPEPDGAGVHPARVDARDVHQRLEPRLAGRCEHAQPGAHQPAVLADQRDAVGDGGERDQVEVGVGGFRVLPGRLQQRPRELMRDAGGAQLRARVAADGRVHDRRVRQPPVGARRVMVGHDHVHARRPRRRDLVDRRDRAVDGDQQPGAARREPLDGRGRQAVAVVDPARQVPVDVGADRPQRAHQDGGGADAVDVVVPVHGDARAAGDVLEDPRRTVAQPSERVERVAHVGREELARRRHVGETAPDEHLGRDVRHVQRGAQLPGGGKVVRSDLEADVGRRHERTVWRGVDGNPRVVDVQVPAPVGRQSRRR